MSDFHSLIKAQEAEISAAPFLFSPSELGAEYIGNPAEQGIYTADRLWNERPAVYKEIVRLLAEGQPIRQIKRICKVHHKTIGAVRLREGESIDTLKKELGSRAFGVARLLLESLEEDVIEGNLKPEAKALSASMLIDKGQLLTGGVTQRVEKVERVDEDEIKRFIDNLPAADVRTSGMGFQAGDVEQMARALGEGSAESLMGPVNTMLREVAIDKESIVLPREKSGSNGHGNKSAEILPGPEEGRGGSVSNEGGPSEGMD